MDRRARLVTRLLAATLIALAACGDARDAGTTATDSAADGDASPPTSSGERSSGGAASPTDDAVTGTAGGTVSSSDDPLTGATVGAAGSSTTSASGASPTDPHAAALAALDEPPLPHYVDESRCASCHTDAAAAWSGSHHDLAMQEVDARSVLGDFDDAVFEHAGATTRFFRRDGRWLVETPGADGAPAEFAVRYTFGVEPLQQLLLELPRGRLGAFSVAWDTERERWFHLQGEDPPPPGDPFHWTGPYQSWNEMCAECHSTDLRANYDAATDAYDTTWEVVDVACQACHGPAGDHLAWADGSYADGSGADDDASYGLAVDVYAGDSFAAVDRCARCHSRRRRVTPEDRPDRPFLDDFEPSLLDEGLYHADGQILDEVYVWGSFVQSRMYHAGVRCTDCHDPHSLDLRAPGDGVCTQCHNDVREDPRFPTLRSARYDTPEHHHHPDDGAGARCVSCHMPARTYMVVDPRRDHGLRVPRPDLAATIGVPEPCTGCHTDRDASWAAEEVERWFPDSERRGPHFAEALVAAREDAPRADEQLAAVARTTELPAIVRATALERLAARGGVGPAEAAEFARDGEPLVRAVVAAALANLPPAERLAPGALLLADARGSVRAQAARAMHPLPETGVDPALRERWEREHAVALATQRALLGTPSGRFNLGVVADVEGRRDEAERLYESALDLDPGFLPAAFNVTNLLNVAGRNARAEEVLRDALAEVPDEGELHYSLGLLLAEEERLEEAADALGRAAELLPRDGRVAYNHALALWRVGRFDGSADALARAADLRPDDPDPLAALVQLAVQRGDGEGALLWASRLAELDPEAESLVQRLRDELDAR